MLEAIHPVGSYPLFFPILVDLQGRQCLVVGAGEVAAAKVAQLLHHNPQVEVVSPRAVQSIRNNAAAGKIQWHRRRFAPEDVRGKFLVIAATGAPRVNKAVFRACNAHGVLCNSVDDPAHCDFFYPAIVRRGPLQIAISTGGCSPALAARLRRELEQKFGPEWGKWVEHVGELRRQILGSKMSAVTRKQRLQQIITPQAFRAFLRRLGQEAVKPGRKKHVRSVRAASPLSATPIR